MFFTVAFFASKALAASLNLANDPATGGPGKFAGEEIRREASAKGMTLGEDAATTPVALTVDKDAKAVAQGYSIRVQNDGGRRAITVRVADAAGAMYGGLDVAEAIRTGTLDSLKDSDHKPHIAQRGTKFNIPLDLRTPSYTDSSDAAQAHIPEMWERTFWTDFLNAMARHRYAEFIEHEVLPLVEKNYGVKLTKDPEGRATMGNSSGGSAALIMAWYHPEWYHRVLTFSGTFVNQQWPFNPETPDGAWGFHNKLIPESPKQPLRIW